MSHENRRELLRQRTAHRAALHRRAAQGIDGRQGEPLEPGDLALSTQTKDLPVEWLVLARTATDPNHLMVAPVDTMALYGPADVQLFRAETGGPIVARCGHVARVAADLLSPRYRTGAVDSEALARALERHRESADPLTGESMNELGSQPDYQDWIEDVVLPACARLQSAEDISGAPPAEDKSNTPSQRIPLITQDLRVAPAPVPELDHGNLLHLYKIAAAILLAAGLAMAAGWFTEHRELERLTQRWERSREHHVPVAFLATQGNLRGQAETFELPEDVRRFILVVFLDPAQLFDHYRVAITADSSAEPIWRDSKIPRGKDAHLGLDLSRQAFPNGRYTLHLHGLVEAPTPAVESAGELTFEIVNN